MFESKLPLPPLPTSDVFNYIFHYGRRAYPWSRVVYRVDGTDETLTLAQLEDQSLRLARALKKKYGIKPNDVISIAARDGIQYPIAFFGALAAGATLALIPIQKELSTPDIASRLQTSNSKLLITDSYLLPLSEPASSLAGGIPIITLNDADVEIPSLADLIAHAQPATTSFALETHAAASDHDAFINRTSGSTGNMKSVLVSHAHYIAAMEGTLRTIPPTTDATTDVWLASSSLGFLINAKLFMGLNLLLGIPVVLMPTPLDETSVSVIKRHAITFILVFPPLIAKLAKATDLAAADVASIKWLLSAGAVIPANLRRAIAQKFPHVDLTLEWATSETMLISIQTSDPSSRREGSSGTLVNGIQARVVDTQTGEDLGPGEPGAILVRNKLARFRGYKDNVEANREFDSGGWFHTGDYGFIDGECNVYIIDRIKEMMRVGDGYGSRISAGDLENVVFEHEAVHSVVVVGIWDEEKATEVPTGFVVPMQAFKGAVGPELARDIEVAAEKKGLTGLKRLSGGVYFVDALPTTGFKINRRIMKGLKRDPVTRLASWDTTPLRCSTFHLFHLSPRETQRAVPGYPKQRPLALLQ
ncbi:AMP-binding enzyme domain protein [Chaetomium sp. MPI-SDFR-AT-0129]|nr:AMP-binding enzyme domain protein [Chaetomium sp. MPI-SDFR-AT-0129]